MANYEVNIPDNFPRGLSGKQLQEHVVSYISEIRDSGTKENVVIKCYPLIALALGELQTRENNLVARISICIGVVSALVAGVALAISINSVRSSDESSARQIKLLEELNTKAAENQKTLSEIRKSSIAPPEKQPTNLAVTKGIPKAP